MLGVESEEELSEESAPGEETVPVHDEPIQHEKEQVVLKRRRPQYYDKRQLLELVLATQELSEFEEPELSPAKLDEEEDHGVKHNCADIWCRTPTLAKCGGKAQHLEKSGVGVLRDF
jgi:hypothetical protein